ncbi:MAG TPA: YpdA family putative bacillithiol disulfide reductase, partial [Terriglobia bacterium]|nr:YpdA family putative bacillithiol disulfide reductase [Terriglobia bacterium]
MSETLDLVIVGAGPSGLAAAIEAAKQRLNYVVLEKGCVTNSIFHFPAHMVFFTTPELLEIGGLPLVCEREKPTRNEALKYYRRAVGAFDLAVRQYEGVDEIRQIGERRFEVRAAGNVYTTRNVALAIGYYDTPNKLGVPGEDLPHVSHYYTEPHSFYNRDVVVIGGKNSAAEAALDLFRAGARVSLVHRRAELGSTLKYWVRPDIENRLKAGEITPYLNSTVQEITPTVVRVVQNGTEREIRADQVFALTGYFTTTRFFEQLGVEVNPETLRPRLDPETFETNVPGVFVAGSAIAGRLNGE